jgi:cytochrome c553
MKTVAMSFALASLALTLNVASAADLAKGKELSQPCLECHEVLDFEGEPAADIEASLKDFASGAKKHKSKITLTNDEIVQVAAYFASGGKK